MTAKGSAAYIQTAAAPAASQGPDAIQRLFFLSIPRCWHYCYGRYMGPRSPRAAVDHCAGQGVCRLLRSVQLRTVGETPVLFMPPAPLRTSGPPLAWPLWTTKPSGVALSAPMITGYAGGPAQRALARSIMAMFVWYRASDHWVSQPANPPYNDTSVFIKSDPVALAGQTSLFYRRVS